MIYDICRYKVRERFYVCKGLKLTFGSLDDGIIYDIKDIEKYIEDKTLSIYDFCIKKELEPIDIEYLEKMHSSPLVYEKGDYIWFKDKKYKIKNKIGSELYIDDDKVVDSVGKEKAEWLLSEIKKIYPERDSIKKEVRMVSVFDKICFWR